MYWLWACLFPMLEMFSAFTEMVEKIRYEVSLNGTRIILAKLLNDRLDPALRRIYLADSVSSLSETTLYLDAEIPPGVDLQLYLDTEALGNFGVVLYTDSEMDTEVDFVVWVPNDLVNFAPPLVGAPDPAWMITLKGLVNTYRAAGRRWKIQYQP